jgi:hypothetical protein
MTASFSGTVHGRRNLGDPFSLIVVIRRRSRNAERDVRCFGAQDHSESETPIGR